MGFCKKKESLFNITYLPDTLQTISNNNIKVDNLFMENDNLVFYGIHNNDPCILQLNGSDNYKPNVVLEFLNYKCDLPRVICNNLNEIEIRGNTYKLNNAIFGPNKQQCMRGNLAGKDGGRNILCGDYIEFHFSSL